MRALWLEKGAMSVREIPEPIPREAEVLIEILAVGLCNTDLELAKGYMNFSGVPGHEFVGCVLAGPEAWHGKRVVGEINFGCGQCGYCARGLSRHCRNRSVLGILKTQGAFAQRLAMPLSELHVLPNDLPNDAAVFVEPLAAALRIPEQMKIAPGQRVLLIGDGKLAQLIARTMSIYGVKLCVVGKHEAKLNLLKDYAEACILLDDYRPDELYSLVIEASGGPKGLELARQSLEPMGTIVLKSTYHNDVEFNFSTSVVDEISIVGSRCGPFAPAIDLLARRLVDPLPLISDYFKFGDVHKAFDRASEKDSLKVIVEMDVENR